MTSVFLRKVDRIALYERILERFMDVDDEDQRAYSRAIVAHLRTLKRRKRSPQPTHPPATVLH
jgi:hypothetical protein